MRLAIIVFLAAFALAAPAHAATVDEAVTTIMALCAGSGETLTITGGAGAGAELSLKKFDAQGHLSGNIHITKTQAKGLVSGLKDKMDAVTAQQADHLRACIAPYREQIMELILGPRKHSDADHSPRVTSVVKPRQPVVIKAAPQPVLFADCRLGLPPAKVPPSGRYYEVNLFGTEHSGGLMEISAPPGSDIAKLPSWLLFKQAYECTITNYSTQPAHDIQFYMNVTYVEAHKDPNQQGAIRSGPVETTSSLLITLPKIDQGKDNPFQFYITNESAYYADVALPDAAVGLSLDNSKIPFRVSKPIHPLMSMSPGQEVQ
jgi:hypothetical protein